MDQASAEKLSRASWFDFELTAVVPEFKGDWRAFYVHKKAEEDSFALAWEKHKEESESDRSPAPSAEYARGLRVLRLEFDSVAKVQEKEIVAGPPP